MDVTLDNSAYNTSYGNVKSCERDEFCFCPNRFPHWRHSTG